MFNPDTRYSKEFIIGSFDVDTRKQATLSCINRYLQEMAASHAENLHLGFVEMMDEKKTWVLVQMLIHIDKYPTLHEKINITTWSNGPDGRFALRDFVIRDAQENIIGGASSTWFVIDVNKKSICRLDKYFEGYNYDNIEYALGRKPERIKPFSDSETQFLREVKYSDLDINGHLNNVRYSDFIIDSFPGDFLNTHNVKEIEMNFLKESKLGNKLYIHTKMGERDNEFLHCLENQDLNNTSFTARTQWQAD